MALVEVVKYVDFQYSHLATVIIDLHEKGIAKVFMVSGRDLLWVQEKIYIRANNFPVLECL